jgi:uncharacterized membrane protein
MERADVNSFVERLDSWLIALVFAGAMFGCWAFGRRWGRRFSSETGEDPGTKFIDASMALLGLLLAFTFAIALGRYDQRRLAVVAESNAIGDFYTCASLLNEPYRSRLQNVIRNYAQDQLDKPHERLAGAEEKESTQRSLERFACMTNIASEAIAAGTPIANPLTFTLNNVTSSSASRLAMYQERLPWSIVLLLFLAAVAPAFLIGEKQGATLKVHRSGSISFIVLVSLVVFVILDLNQPHRGMIMVSQEPLARVIQSMGK